jgi:hypothetical protein
MKACPVAIVRSETDRLHSAYRPQPGFESGVVSFHGVVRVPLKHMSRGGR